MKPVVFLLKISPNQYSHLGNHKITYTIDLTNKMCSCASFYDKGICKHLIACSLIEKINLRGLDAHSRLNIRYRRRPNDVPILNSSLNDNCDLLDPTEPTETQIPNFMTQITSSTAWVCYSE